MALVSPDHDYHIHATHLWLIVAAAMASSVVAAVVMLAFPNRTAGLLLSSTQLSFKDSATSSDRVAINFSEQLDQTLQNSINPLENNSLQFNQALYRNLPQTVPPPVPLKSH